MSVAKKILLFVLALLLVLVVVELGGRLKDSVLALCKKNKTGTASSVVAKPSKRAYCVLILGGRVDGRGDGLSLALEMEEILARMYPQMPVRVISRTMADSVSGNLIEDGRKYIKRYRPDCIVFITAGGLESLRFIDESYLFSPDTLDGLELPFDTGPKKEPAFYFARADALIDRGLWSSAYLVFAAALKNWPENDDFYVGLARCLRECGRYGLVTGFLDRAMELAPDHTGALVEYGLLFQAQKNFTQAEDFLTRAWRMDNESERACFSLARFYLKQGYTEKLAMLVTEVKELSPDWGGEFVDIDGEIPDEADLRHISADTWLKTQYLRPKTEVSAELEKLIALTRKQNIVSAVVSYPLTYDKSLRRAAERARADIYLSAFGQFFFSLTDEEEFFDADCFKLTRDGTRLLGRQLAGLLGDEIKSYFSTAVSNDS